MRLNTDAERIASPGRFNGTGVDFLRTKLSCGRYQWRQTIGIAQTLSAPSARCQSTGFWIRHGILRRLPWKSGIEATCLLWRAYLIVKMFRERGPIGRLIYEVYDMFLEFGVEIEGNETSIARKCGGKPSSPVTGRGKLTLSPPG